MTSNAGYFSGAEGLADTPLVIYGETPLGHAIPRAIHIDHLGK